ncbi:MAG: LamG domain-containing protein [Flavobacteriales bacterium]|nr:MAG: LamG domain-containing protein [Flavobacteriales bacterium]
MAPRYASAVFILIATLNSSAQNTALDFDGIDDNVVVPTASALIANAPGLTLACRFYPRNTAPFYPDFDCLAGMRNEFDCDFYLLQISPANTLEGRLRNSAGAAFTVSSTSVMVNQWQHAALVFDGAALKLYMNGSLTASVPANGTITNTSVDFLLGDLLFQLEHFYLDGRLDEVALFSRAVSATEVECLAYGDVADTTGLQLAFGFEEGIANGNNTGTTSIEDLMGNINGTPNNFAFTGQTSNFVDGFVGGIIQSITICQGGHIIVDGQQVSAPGTYTGTITNSLGCSTNSIVNLTVTPVDVGVTPLNINLFADASGAQLQWLDCDNGFTEIPGATGTQFTPSLDGSYAVEVTQNGCTDTSACYTVVGVGIDESNNAPFHVWLDAVNDRVVVADAPGAVLMLTDAIGRTVRTGTVVGARWEMPLTGLPNGQYLVVVRKGDVLRSLPLVLAR